MAEPGRPYAESPAPVGWSHAIACLWSRGRGEYDGPADRLVPPDNCGDLLLEVDDEGGVLSCSVVGAMTRPFLAPSGGPGVVGVRFRPGWLGAMLGVPAHHLQDARVALDDAAPALARSLGARPSLPEWLDRLPDVLPRREPAPRVREAMTLLAGGGARVSEVCRTLRVSRQWLAREFARDVGVGPKVYARVARVQHAVAAAGRGEPWSAVALRLGYADQSHLVREVHALRGRSPGTLSRSSRRASQEALALSAIT